MIKAVLFDLDGSLVTTDYEHREFVVGCTLKDLGTKASPELIDKFWFEEERDKTIRESFHVDPELFWNIFHIYDTSEFRNQFTRPYSDVKFIRELRRKGYKTGIVTDGPNYIASFEIEMIGRELFDAVVDNSAQVKPKPSAEGLEKCLGMLEVKNNEAIYVGNSRGDMEAARNAHVIGVLINRGEYSFPNAKPSFQIYSL